MSTTPASPLLPTAAAPTNIESSNAPFTVAKRYSDAYLVARVQTGLGNTIKIVSLGIGGFIALVSLLGASGSNNPIGSGLAMIGFVAGLAIAGIGFVLGILISSQGQILKATLDSAVNSSPFLNNGDRAAIMSL